MEAGSENRKDSRVDDILSQILRLSTFDCSGRVELSGSGDELDAIAAGLNTLAEELDARLGYIRNNQDRISNIMNILMDYTVMNFKSKIQLSEAGDEIDAVSAGLNTLAEELEYAQEEQKRYSQQLELSNRLLNNNIEKLHTILDTAPDAIIATNVDHVILEWNHAAEMIYGLSKDKVMGKILNEVVKSEYPFPLTYPKVLELVNANGRWVGELHQETERRRKKMLIHSTISALKSENGTQIGYLKVNRDITEQRKVENEVVQKTEELKRSNAELEQFAYVASHDLQEPLRMITSYVQLLEKRYKSRLEGDAIEFINFAVDGANRMQVLIRSLLEYSRINRAKPFEYVDLDETLQDVMRDLDLAIKDNNAKIEFGKMPVVFGDDVLLGQLFFNLLNNAIKFKGDKPVHIKIDYTEKDDEFQFAIRDNGIGIAKEYQEKIFVIFQRLHTKDKYPGTGIGLAICKKIVEKHKGKIWVESEPGQGSAFYFTLKKMRFSTSADE
jgi:PAS domain S-box-containing protein